MDELRIFVGCVRELNGGLKNKDGLIRLYLAGDSVLDCDQANVGNPFVQILSHNIKVINVIPQY